MMNRRGLIAIAGIVGVGKTTLAENLAAALKAELILEEYDKNPFLADAAQGLHEVALASELFFLFSRVRQLHRDRIGAYPTVVCDYVFRKNGIFAAMNLDTEEYTVYRRLEESVEPYLAPPNVVIYLQSEPKTCLERIARRGRPFEKVFSLEFLEQLHEAYERLFDDWRQCPVIQIDSDGCDFRRQKDVQKILSQLEGSDL